jgi:hypothetical protein
MNFLSHICQSLYKLKPKVQSERCAPYSPFAHYVLNCPLLCETTWNLERLSQDGGQAYFYKKTSATVPLKVVGNEK